MKEKYPKLYKIVLNLKGPDDSTIEDVKRILKHYFAAAKLVSVEEIKNEDNSKST